MSKYEVLKHLKETYTELSKSPFKIRSYIVCKDGFTFSVQASERHACEPKCDLQSGLYNSVEVGLLDEFSDLLTSYMVTESDDPYECVYYCVPVNIVESIVVSHGGLK